MIDDGNRDLDVTALMAKVHEQIGGNFAASLVSSAGSIEADITTLVAGMEEALQAAESASAVRTSLGKSPMVRRLQPFQGLILRALAYILRDQRNVNAALIEALRKSMRLNVRLAEELDRLKTGQSRTS